MRALGWKVFSVSPCAYCLGAERVQQRGLVLLYRREMPVYFDLVSLKISEAEFKQ